MLEDPVFPLRLLESHDYAVIDRVLWPELADDHPDLLLVGKTVVPPLLANDTALLPLLLPLAELADASRTALFEKLQAQHEAHKQPLLSCLFQSPVSFSAMLNHWQSRLLLLWPTGSHVFVRYYAPEVWVQILRLYREEQIRVLFGPISAWTFYLDGAWHTMPRPDIDSDWPVRLDDKQADSLSRIQAVNRSLAALPEVQRPRYPSVEYAAYSQQIDALISRAQNHGLLREDDQVAFAVHGMTVHTHFDSHPDIQKTLSSLDTEQQFYADAASLLSDEDWQRIRNELAFKPNITQRLA